MWLLVGLGNPGREYQHNRHNVGFMAVEAIARRHKFLLNQAKFHGITGSGEVEGVKLIALLPQTYMNRSGASVGEAARFYKIPPERVLVLHDELDVPFGRVKTKLGGGHGGHNGLKSIDSALGQNYHRLRIGIGHPGDKEKVTGHVLGDFTRKEEQELEPLLDDIARYLPLLLERRMAEFTSKLAPPPPPKAPKPAPAE
jgi:PTH1 family peptidyl-tRNA hydrolase